MASDNIQNSLNPNSKDYSELQKELVLKTEVFGLLFQQEKTIEGYKVLTEFKELNTNILSKEDYLRFEASVDTSSRKLFDLFANEKIDTWLKTDDIKCISNRVVDTLKSNSDVYCMTLQIK